MDEDEDFGVLKINQSFAKNYDRYRQKEELQKLKDKYGDVSNEESSSSSEIEDEDAEALTAQVEKDWLRTYAAVKSRDPRIYKKDVKFYHSNSSSSSDEDTTGKGKKSQKKSSKQKPVTIKDYERKVILEKGGVLSDEDEADYQERNKEELGYYEEQEEIKKSFQTALESDDSDTELLKHRPKTDDEKNAEEDDYREWLKGQTVDPGEDRKYDEDLVPLKEYWTDPKLEEGEKFLRDYILNKGYLEKDKDRIPTYEEIVDEAGFSSEEEILKKQEEFETKYNFRYEEPDPEFIKRYPRTISESVRREENKRSVKRAEVKNRKDLEKHKKREELKQLKNLKKREILDKMERLKAITGNPSLGLNEEDLEGDFDPEKYDRLMQNVFDEDYYGEREATKPVFSDDEELGLEDDWDNWPGREEFEEGYGGSSNTYEGPEDGPHVDDPDFNMDADYDPTTVQPKRQGKKQKKKSRFAQAVYQSKPVFDPNEKSFETYFDEYYKLDYEDIIGDLPCRFKYRKTVPNSYGLTVQEILSADDKELNSWCSVKKMSQYKGDQEEYTDLKKYRKKAKKKYNVLTSLGDSPKKHSASNGVMDVEDNDSQKTQVKKKQKPGVETATCDSSVTDMQVSDGAGESPGMESADAVKNSPKKKRKRESGDEVLPNRNESEGNTGDRLSGVVYAGKLRDSVAKKTKRGGPRDVSQSVTQNSRQKKKQRRKKKHHQPIMSDDRLKAYGINPKTFKQKMKKSKTS